MDKCQQGDVLAPFLFRPVNMILFTLSYYFCIIARRALNI